MRVESRTTFWNQIDKNTNWYKQSVHESIKFNGCTNISPLEIEVSIFNRIPTTIMGIFIHPQCNHVEIYGGVGSWIPIGTRQFLILQRYLCLCYLSYRLFRFWDCPRVIVNDTKTFKGVIVCLKKLKLSLKRYSWNL